MKKVLATILALVMAIGLCSISWATESELPTAVNGVIKLTENVTLTARWEVAANTEITLDLNGYSITSAGQVIMNNGKLTITDNKGGGKIVSTGSQAIGVGSNSVTNIQKAIVESVEGAVITGYATGATINIYDGTFSASDNAVIAGNGKSREGTGNTINISGGVFNGKITTPGYVACGIYAPWKDNINVTGGTFNITGGAGIVARAGSVSVSNATINTTGNATGKVGDSRVVVPCSAIVFDSEAAYPALTNTSAISVESGTFTSEADAISVVKPEGEGAAERVAVTGGTFSTDVTEYLAEGKILQKNGDTYTAVTNSGITSGTYTAKPTVPDGYKVVENTDGTFTVEKVGGYYYYYPTTDTKTTDTKGSPKTFDAGIALYVGMALTSAAGVAFVGKKRED